MKIILARLRFKCSNWLDNKKQPEREKVMAKYETLAYRIRRRKKLSESGFITHTTVSGPSQASTMRKKSRGECRKRKKQRRETQKKL